MSLIPLETFATTIGPGALLGLDWGLRRTGLAISDPAQRFAMPLRVLSGSFWPGLCGVIHGLCQERSIQGIVLGWPFLCRPQDLVSTSKTSHKIQSFITTLLRQKTVPITWWTERYSTQEVAHWCPQPPKDIDAHAAAIMLQGALQRMASLCCPFPTHAPLTPGDLHDHPQN